MPTGSRAEVSDLYPSVHEEVARLSAAPEIRSAFNWFRAQEPQLSHWQAEMARIAAPPFGEAPRAAWLSERFLEIGLDDVRVDDVGNVFGIHPGFGKRYIALSAHIDTVFPAGTPLNIRQQGTRLYGPGVSDNGAGVAALLGIAARPTRSSSSPAPSSTSAKRPSLRRPRAHSTSASFVGALPSIPFPSRPACAWICVRPQLQNSSGWNVPCACVWISQSKPNSAPPTIAALRSAKRIPSPAKWW